jgi:DNA ligase-1
MGIELGIGESLIIKAIAQSPGRKPADIKADLLKVGDLGLVAEVSLASERAVLWPRLDERIL